MNVLYEDNHIILIEKPINVPTQEDSSKDMDVLRMVKQYLKEKYNKPGDAYCGLVSRLDRPTGGVMVLAKTSKAASRLTTLFQDHQSVIKEYLAVVPSSIEEGGTYEDELVKNHQTNTVEVVKTPSKNSKHAKLTYQVLSRNEDYALVKVRLYTGRSHQIRVQFASRGYPLYGDQRYNPNAKKGQQLALWSYHLSFEHPVSHEIIDVYSVPPKTQPWITLSL